MYVKEILDRYGIVYVESGPNVARDHIAVNCPFCKREHDPDPSHHMGISLVSPVFGCWRNPQHRGKSMWYLISALTGISFDEARKLTGEEKEVKLSVDRSAWNAEMEKLAGNGRVDSEVPDNSKISAEFEKFWPLARNKMRTGRVYVDYMKERGFSDVDVVADQFDLRFATTGEYKQRIVMPIKRKNRLEALVGRTIRKDSPYARYLTSEGSNMSDLLFGEDDLERGGNLLLVLEGMFDVMKMSLFLNELKDAKCTCLFSVNLGTESRINRLRLYAKKFDRCAFLLDRKQGYISYMWERDVMAGSAFALEPEHFYPQGVSDPGELNPKLHRNHVLNSISRIMQ